MSDAHAPATPSARVVGALAVLVSVASVPNLVLAQDARQIMTEAQGRTEVDSQRYEGLLQVIDARGRVSDKRWTFERVGSHGSSRAIVRFTAPADVRGVALLIVNHPDRASDQWMWTPAIERDRRIALQDRSTRFFGTDFSFEDLEERDVHQFDFALEGEESLDAGPVWKIRSTPRRTRSSQYTHSFVWVRKSDYAIVRVESYTRAGLVRRLVYSKFENIEGIQTARVLEMTDLTRDSRTRLTLENVQYKLPLRSEDFTLQALRRQ